MLQYLIIQFLSSIKKVISMLAESNLYKTVFEATNVGMAIADLSGRFIQVNKSLCNFLGYTKEELESKTFKEISYETDLKEDLHHIEEINKGHIDTFSMEKRYFKKDGQLAWVDLTVTAVRKDDKKVDYYIAVIKDINKLKKAQLALRMEEERTKLYLDVAAVMLLALDRDGKIQLINPKGCEILGYSQEELLGKDWVETALPQSVQADVKKLMQEIFNGNVEPVECFENSVVTKSGEERMIAWHNGAIKDHYGHIVGIMTSGQDITEEKQAQEELRLQKEEFETIFNTSKDGIAILDKEANFLDFNDAYLEMTGYTREELLKINCISLSAPEDRERSAEALKTIFEFGYIKGFEKTCVVKDGKKLYINMTATLLPDKQRVLISTKDIGLMKEHEQQLEYIAHYDALTGLPNRILESDRLRQGIIQTQRRGTRLAVLYLDLDGFKAVNDTYGHHVGDQLLIGLSARMKQVLREGDTFARLGGDEFIAILVDLESISSAILIIDRLLEAASLPIQLGDLIVQVSASIGVTFYPQDDEVDGDQLIRQADQAMYIAKHSGKNRYHLFDTKQDSELK